MPPPSKLLVSRRMHAAGMNAVVAERYAASRFSENKMSTSGTDDSLVPNKRSRLQDFAYLPARLASITLTRDHLKQLDALFAGPELFEQFSAAVTGCLVRIDRQATGQKKDVIAQISDLVSPLQTRQLSLPNRRIFVINLGYFEIDHVAQQMPDQPDYEDWIADMEMQSLPLPSDEFLHEKALSLRELLSRASTTNVAEGSCVDEAATKVEEEEEGLRSIMESEMPATSSSAAMKEEVISVSSDTEYEVDDDEDDEYESDDTEAEADQQIGEQSDEATDGEMSVDKLVHIEKQLNRMCLTLDLVQSMVRYRAVMDCLPGCFVKCRSKATSEASSAITNA